MFYIDEMLPEIQIEHPDANGIEARKIAIKMFRSLSAEEKQVCLLCYNVDKSYIYRKKVNIAVYLRSN